MRKIFILALLMFCGMSFNISADPPTDEQKRITGIERAMKATVKIIINSTENALKMNLVAGNGTGFYIAPNYILTNSHVVLKPGVMSIDILRLDGQKCLGSLDYREETLDLALIKTDCEGGPLTLADTVRLGQDVYVTGNPRSLDWIATAGMVARVIDLPSYKRIVADINLEPGNSGSPMVNGQGKLVGVVDAMNKEANYMGFAVHLDDVKQFLKRAGL